MEVLNYSDSVGEWHAVMSTAFTAAPSVLTWATGGPYPHDYKPRTAGGACDPCWRCEQSPKSGERCWMNNYGDLYCDACARMLAAGYEQAYPLAQCHGCGESDRHLSYLADGTGICYRCKLAEMGITSD